MNTLKFDLNALQSAINRPVHNSVRCLIEFWNTMPKEYTKLSTMGHQDEQALFLQQVREAAEVTANLLNHLAAVQRDLEWASASPRVVVLPDGTLTLSAAKVTLREELIS